MNKKQAKELVNDMKKKFPKPISIVDDDDSPGAYCIGGAVCRYTAVKYLQDLAKKHNYGNGFTYMSMPIEEDVAKSLMSLNMKLNEGDAAAYAADIINENDAHHFSKAWKHVENALAYKEI